jgi:cysteine-dependent adenosine diphosphate thiazole synthase
MAPSVAEAAVYDAPTSTDHLKNLKNGVAASKTYDIEEDYTGNYKFAPIEESQVSRAMIKR